MPKWSKSSAKFALPFLLAALLAYEDLLGSGFVVPQVFFWSAIFGVVLLFNWLPADKLGSLATETFLLGSTLALIPLIRFGNFFGMDIYWEYSFFAKVLQSGHWVPTSNFYASSFSDTITPSVLAQFTGMESHLSFEIYAVLLMGVVALFAFTFYRKVFGHHANYAFVLFMFASGLATNSSVKQLTAFAMLLLWLIVLFPKSGNLVLLLPIFVLATIQAHPFYFFVGVVLSFVLLLSDKVFSKGQVTRRTFEQKTGLVFLLALFLGIAWLLYGGGLPYSGIVNEVYYSLLQAIGLVSSPLPPLNSSSVILHSSLGVSATIVNLVLRVLIIIGTAIMFISKSRIMKNISVATIVVILALVLLFFPGFSWAVNIGQMYLVSSLFMFGAAAIALGRLVSARSSRLSRFTSRGKWIALGLVVVFCMNGFLWPPVFYSQTNQSLVLKYQGPMLYHVTSSQDKYFAYIQNHEAVGTNLEADDLTEAYLGFRMNATIESIPLPPKDSAAGDLQLVSSQYALVILNGVVYPAAEITSQAGLLLNKYFSDGTNYVQQPIS